MRLIVRDTGDGMAPEIMEHIFEPFFTTKNMEKGLVWVWQWCMVLSPAMGGITVESAPEQGATFAVYLPRLANPTTSTVDIEEPLPGGVSASAVC